MGTVNAPWPSWWPAGHWRRSQIPSTNPAPPFFWLWWRVPLLVIGIFWAASGIVSELRFGAILSRNEASAIGLGLIRAEGLFPWPERLRIANAVFLAVDPRMPSQLGLMALRRALEGSPHHPTLHYWMVVELVADGDLGQAWEFTARLLRLAPNWPEARALARNVRDLKGIEYAPYAF